jgi:hypothetical protein
MEKSDIDKPLTYDEWTAWVAARRAETDRLADEWDKWYIESKQKERLEKHDFSK